MKRFVSVGVFLAALLAGTAAGEEPSGPEVEVRSLLETQVAAWNRGDVEAFMETYWKSEETAYVSSKGIERGWQAVLDRYRRVYPDRRAMGTTEFSGVEISLLSPNAALVLGHWQLKTDGPGRGGVFTLVVRRFPEGWRIVHDHSSVSASGSPQKPS
jgi:beta-aspartyl-peptidase (threonine type)